jgi:hypothetical protein
VPECSFLYVITDRKWQAPLVGRPPNWHGQLGGQLQDSIWSSFTLNRVAVAEAGMAISIGG